LLGYSNGHAPLTAAQAGFIGLVEPDVTGATWVEVPDLLEQLLSRLPVEGWERGSHDPF
jgi:hypothetical protein